MKDETSLPKSLALLSETALDAVVIINGDGEVLGWNRLAEQIFGWSEAEVRGRGLSDFIVPPGHRRAHADGMLRYQATGEARVLNRRIEITALRKDGSEFPIELSITTAEISSGSVFVGYLRDITERKAAEHALRAARDEAAKIAAEQEAILSQLAEAVIVADIEGRLAFVNQAAARLHGVATLGVAPDQYSDTYHLLTENGLPYPSKKLPLARAVRGEIVSEERWRIRRPDGSEVLAVGSARPITDVEGNQTGAVLTARDETERHSAEKQVQENEARLRALTDNLPGGAVYQLMSSSDGAERKLLFLSQSYERLTGVPVTKVLDDPGVVYGAIHHDDLPKLVEAERAAAATLTSFDAQVRFYRADGEVLWLRFISAPRQQPNGASIWDGLIIDATARITAEIAVRELNANLETRVAELAAERDRIWSASADLFVVCGFDGLYRSVNPAWERQLGYPTETLIGARFDALVHPEDIASTTSAFESLVAGGVLDNLDVRIRASDGSYRCISWTCVPDGEQFYASGRDIDQRKKLEEQLRQSQKMDAVGQLTGGIAHDFNNLLTIIRSAVDLMRRPDIPEPRRARYVDAISDTVERASKLTNQLLAFARRQPLKPQVFDVGNQIRIVADLIKPLLGSRLQVELSLTKQPLYVEVDLSQFETAVVNLAVNARDAMESDGALTIGLEEVSLIPPSRAHAGRSGSFAAISVEDTGAGIAPDDIVQIFEPFFTTKEVGRGTGLGLSQVYGFVHQSGGDIDVKSRLGEGTSFTIYLPLTSCPPTVTEEPTDNAGSTLGKQRTRVLVVEDNEAIGKFTQESLTDLGYDTSWAANGQDALAALRDDGLAHDVVFTDVMMPGMSGIELAQEIRHRHPGIPVVLTSGYSEVIAKDGSYGFDLLQKPYSVEALSKIIQKAARASALR